MPASKPRSTANYKQLRRGLHDCRLYGKRTLARRSLDEGGRLPNPAMATDAVALQEKELKL
jgi:hypothetical protein